MTFDTFADPVFFNAEMEFENLLSQSFPSKIEAQIALADFIRNANAFGKRGAFDANVKRIRPKRKNSRNQEIKYRIVAA